MGEIVFDALGSIFGSTLSENATEFLELILNALRTLMSNSNATVLLNIFLAIGCALMTVFMFMDILNKTSQDMITLERLVLIFIKWFLGCAILIYLPEIMYGLFDLMSKMYEATKAGLSDVEIDLGMTFFAGEGNPDPSKWPKSYELVKEAFTEAGYEGNLAFVKHFASVLTAIFIRLINFVASVGTFLFAIGNAVTLVVRMIFAPIAVAQCFDEGQRSTAIRYLKKFAADGLTFAIIFGIFWVATNLQASLIPSLLDVTEITVASIPDVLWGSHIFALIAIQLAAVGGTMKANQIANDVLGC